MYHLVWDVNNGERYACMREGGIWEISVPFTEFYYKIKTAVKYKYKIKM